jgi:hypothetical protein
MVDFETKMSDLYEKQKSLYHAQVAQIYEIINA